jgi:hypothetical protein
MPDKTDEKQGKFQKGQSGNPFGRPKGVRNKAILLAEKLLENETDEICRQAIELAKKGNIQAIKIILDRILPPRKETPITIDLPVMKASTDILEAINQVTLAICCGKISPSEGETLSRIIERQAKAIEMNEFEQRLKTLEDRQSDKAF